MGSLDKRRNEESRWVYAGQMCVWDCNICFDGVELSDMLLSVVSWASQGSLSGRDVVWN